MTFPMDHDEATLRFENLHAGQLRVLAILGHELTAQPAISGNRFFVRDGTSLTLGTID
jgi:hypothetical protein